MAAAIKVLFLGDARGDLHALIKKAEQVHRKSGPFSAAFCLGRLMDDQGGILNADKPIPSPSFPIYLLGAGESQDAMQLPLSHPPLSYDNGVSGSSGLAPSFIEGKTNLHYLGRSGVAKIADLNVAFLDGIHAQDDTLSSDLPSTAHHHYTNADMEHLRSKIETMEGEVDLLLTCEWPAGITQGLEAFGPTAAPPSEGLRVNYGSKEVAHLATLARPRYHLAAGEEALFARLPYYHRDLGVGPRVTRFVALGPMSGEPTFFLFPSFSFPSISTA